MRKIDFILHSSFQGSDFPTVLQGILQVDGEIQYVNNIDDAFKLANKSKRDVFLGIDEKLDYCDLKFFFEHTKGHSFRGMTYEKNYEQKLYWPGIGEQILGDEYHDGFCLKDIYYLSSQKRPYVPSMQDLLPIPVNNQIQQKSLKKAALFLDRDGIINKDVSYLHKIEDIKIYENIIPIIKKANEKNIPVIVLTNQAGVARGMFTEQDVSLVNQEIKKILAEKGVNIDAIYSCFYIESGNVEQYKKKSLLRKPMPGLLLQALNDFPIDISRSFMVGDKLSDQLVIPGLKHLIVQRNYKLDGLEKRYADLNEVYQYLLQELF